MPRENNLFIGQEDQILDEYKNGATLQKVATKHGFSVTFIICVLNRNGEKTRPRNKYNINLDYFENIDNEEKAYWLGFITADGYIGYAHKKYGIIGLELQQNDKKHIEKFIKQINYNGEIKNRRNRETCGVNIYAPKMVNDLEKLGIRNNKAKTIKPCELIPKELLRHYWRGLIDGDGSIYESIKTRTISLSGNEFMTFGFKQFLLNNGIKTNAKIYPDRNCYKALFGGFDLSKTIIKLLYENANVFLDRKMKIAKKVIDRDIALREWQKLI